MALNSKALARFEPQLRSLFRVVAAFTYSLHGWQKAFGLFGGHRPELTSLLGVGGIIETIGGAMIILGLCTRPVAFVLSGEMAVAYFHTHAPRGFWPITNGGEITVVYCFFFLWLSAAGPGPWSLDSRMKRSSQGGSLLR